MRDDRSVASSVFWSRVAGAVEVIVAEIPGLARSDQLITASAADTTGSDERGEPRADCVVRVGVAANVPGRPGLLHGIYSSSTSAAGKNFNRPEFSRGLEISPIRCPSCNRGGNWNSAVPAVWTLKNGHFMRFLMVCCGYPDQGRWATLGYLSHRGSSAEARAPSGLSSCLGRGVDRHYAGTR